MVRVFVKTYGCSFNQSDSEIIKGNLIKEGYEISQNDTDADLIIINSCSVKNMSETKFFNDIKKYSEDGKMLIGAGCIPQAEQSYLNTKLKNISIIGTNNLQDIGEVVERTLNGEVYHKIETTTFKKPDEEQRFILQQARLDLSKVRLNNFVEIIPINEGCLSACTYCKTKSARGNLMSYSIENIKEIMQKAIARGAKEIYLTSQDTGCYGFDIGTNLVELLKELLKIEGDYKIRIGMGNPNHFKNIIDDILDLMLEDNRIYKFLHIPLQAGSNRILKEMRRNYKLEDYNKIVEKIRAKITQLTLANDIIVAYPTETKEEFEETLEAIKETNVLNFSRFWLRPNTPCEKLYSGKDFIDGLESKRRAKLIKEEFEKIATNHNKKYIGLKEEVLVSQIGKEGTDSIIARDEYYRHIIIKIGVKRVINLGDRIRVKIIGLEDFSYIAELV